MEVELLKADLTSNGVKFSINNIFIGNLVAYDLIDLFKEVTCFEI